MTKLKFADGVSLSVDSLMQTIESGKSITSSAFNVAISTLKKNGRAGDAGLLQASATLFHWSAA